MQIFEDPEFEEDSDEESLDQEGVARLLLKQRMELTAYIQSIVRDIHMAEDVFQDVCVKAIKHHETFKDSLAPHEMDAPSGPQSLRSIRCAARRTRPLVLNEEALGTAGTRLAGAEDEGASPKAIEASPRLHGQDDPLQSRDICGCATWRGWPGTQVAETLNRKVDTVYKALTPHPHGPARLRQTAAELGREGDFRPMSETCLPPQLASAITRTSSSACCATLDFGI